MKDVIDRSEGMEMTDLICDGPGCTESINFDTCDFHEINREAKERGWLSRNFKGQWVDFCCPECFKRYKEDRLW